MFLCFFRSPPAHRSNKCCWCDVQPVFFLRARYVGVLFGCLIQRPFELVGVRGTREANVRRGHDGVGRGLRLRVRRVLLAKQLVARAGRPPSYFGANRCEGCVLCVVGWSMSLSADGVCVRHVDGWNMSL